ncbi:hypothetical protein, partial [Streptomyces sp. JW3]|uniref:hypothetical protein n=1 Tax=Streptomyces sp. JW3 TaxID=3456955 RepID=UPI003FA43E18
MSSPYAAQVGERERLKRLGGGIMRVLLERRHTGGRPSLFRSTVPTAAVSPVHVHPDEDELLVLPSGGGLVWIGDRRFEIGAGGDAFLPRDFLHIYRFGSNNVGVRAIAYQPIHVGGLVLDRRRPAQSTRRALRPWRARALDAEHHQVRGGRPTRHFPHPPARQAVSALIGAAVTPDADVVPHRAGRRKVVWGQPSPVTVPPLVKRFVGALPRRVPTLPAAAQEMRGRPLGGHLLGRFPLHVAHAGLAEVALDHGGHWPYRPAAAGDRAAAR